MIYLIKQGVKTISTTALFNMKCVYDHNYYPYFAPTQVESNGTSRLKGTSEGLTLLGPKITGLNIVGFRFDTRWFLEGL